MTMNESLTLLLAWVAGVLLGIVFFGGLWWTVRKIASSQKPARLLFASLMVRMCVALAGFYFVFGGNWRRLLVCLLGFLSARLLVTWLIRPRKAVPVEPARRAIHAP